MSKIDDLNKKVRALKDDAPKAPRAPRKPKSENVKPKSETAAPETQVKKRRGGHPTKPLPVIIDADIAEITDKEELFCQAVVKGKSNSDAYREAYETARMKPESINRMAHDLRQNLKITSRIAFLRDQAARAAVITESRVLTETGRIAFADLRKAFAEDGSLLPPHKWPDELASAVKSIKVVEMAGSMAVNAEDGSVTHVPMYTKEIVLCDKNSALEKLFKHMGMFEKDNRQRNPFAESFTRLPDEVQKLIAEKLNAIAGPVIPRQSDARTSGRVTH